MNLAQLDLNLLVALDALLRERNVTRAGESIGLSQPAMSSALGRLRRLLDDELLVRTGREYHLTALAQEIEAPLQDALRQIETLIENRPSFDPSRDKRTFSLAVSDYAVFLLIQPALVRIMKEAVDVAIRISPVGGDTAARLESGDIDLTILPRDVGPHLPGEVLFSDRWVCIVWKHHSSVEDTITLDQYLSLPHLSYGHSIDSGDSTGDRAIEALNVSRHVRAAAHSFFLLPFLLIGTPLVALIHERLAMKLSNTVDIRIVEPLFKMPEITETMYWHPRHTSDPAHRWLRGILSEVSGAL
jgi:DNA-binding transcriptional LysR family regulator